MKAISPLTRAAQETNLDAIQALIKKRTNVNRASEKGWTALHQCASTDYFSGLEALLKAGAIVGPTDSEWNTPLHVSVASKSMQCFRALIEAGADVNAENSQGMTPLHLSLLGVENELNTEIIATLLRKGAGLNDKDCQGWTPLHYAAFRNAENCFRFLLECGATFNLTDALGRTPEELTESREIKQLSHAWAIRTTLENTMSGAIARDAKRLRL